MRPRSRLPFLIAAVLLVLLAIGLAMREEKDKAEEQEQTKPFDYYALVLGWSPSYCAAEGKQRRDRQCETPHGFVLHGLWPQYAKGWPQDCKTRKRPWVSQTVIDKMLDIMPSKSLIIHEYRAHGTCSGLEPEEYFRLARDAYTRIALPPRFEGTASRLQLSPAEIEAEFLKANSWLEPSMISVSCRAEQLLDVRFCFGRDLSPRSCGPNEQRRLCRTGSVTIPPAEAR